jgi:hypothetical protein
MVDRGPLSALDPSLFNRGTFGIGTVFLQI